MFEYNVHTNEVNWIALEKYDWVQPLKGCPQNPVYHGEGDVWNHTKMVIEYLISMSEFAELKPEEKEILYASALFHDIAKPICVKEEDGVIISKNHSKIGRKKAREILCNFNIDFDTREQICNLVGFHGLPVWFMDKKESAKEVIRASLLIDTKLLYLLSKADVNGRICEDSEELNLKVDLFRESCKELGCYSKEKHFHNDHSRFYYFSKENSFMNYEAYDDTKFKVILMSGLPGSGKDYWIEKNNKENLPIISLDEIRKELKIKPHKEQGKVVQTAKEKAKEFMRKKQDFIWNATNTTKLMRSQLINLFRVYGAKIRIVYIDITPDKSIENMNKRNRKVSLTVVQNLYKKLDIPDLSECHELTIEKII